MVFKTLVYIMCSFLLVLFVKRKLILILIKRTTQTPIQAHIHCPKRSRIALHSKITKKKLLSLTTIIGFQ